jgi:maltose O-acetyltransferase
MRHGGMGLRRLMAVLAGVTISRGTVGGAGSVVTRSLPPDVLASGNPARGLRNLTAVNDP